MNLSLSDEQATVLERELRRIIDDDRYPFSPRIRTLREILHMIRPEPVRDPLPPRKHYEPPRATAKKRRQWDPKQGYVALLISANGRVSRLVLTVSSDMRMKMFWPHVHD